MGGGGRGGGYAFEGLFKEKPIGEGKYSFDFPFHGVIGGNQVEKQSLVFAFARSLI